MCSYDVGWLTQRRFVDGMRVLFCFYVALLQQETLVRPVLDSLSSGYGIPIEST